jgi:hypothetical protein
VTDLAVPDDRPPWEKQPGESRQAFANFAHYRDLSRSRSLARAAVDLGKAKATLEDQSRKYRWQDRVDAYDAYMERRLREADERALVAYRERQARTGVQLQALGMRRLVGDPANQIEAVDLNRVGVDDARKLVVSGLEAEARGRGDPLVRGGSGRIEVPFDILVDLLNQLAEIARKFIPEDRLPLFEREAATLRIGGRG